MKKLPSTFTTETPPATFSLIRSSMRLSRLWSLTRGSTPRRSSCMSVCLGWLSSCFFLSSIISPERKVVPDPSQSRRGQTRMTWTLSGFPNPISVLQGQARPVPGRGNPSVTLVLTLTNPKTPPESELMINKDSDLQQIQSDYHYLTVNGHEICIMDFIVSVEIIIALQAGLWLTNSLLLPLCSPQSSLLDSLTAELLQHSD